MRLGPLQPAGARGPARQPAAPFMLYHKSAVSLRLWAQHADADVVSLLRCWLAGRLFGGGGHLAWRRETMQRSQAAFSDSRASLPAPGPLTDAAAIRGVHHPAPSSPRLGAGGQEFDWQASSILANRLIVRLLLLMPFFSRALRKASRAQPPHKTRRLIHLPTPPNPRRAASHTNPPTSTWKASRNQRPHKTHRLI